MHAFALGQETLSRLPFVPPGVRVGLIDHLFPFQRSAKVEKTVKSLVDWPTAVQALGDAHETL
jgi:hypothetical protein